MNTTTGRLFNDKKMKSLSVETYDGPSNSSSAKETPRVPKLMDKKVHCPQPHCFELGLECASRVLCQPSLGVYLDQPSHATWLASACSAVTAVVQFATFGECLPSIPANGLSIFFALTAVILDIYLTGSNMFLFLANRVIRSSFKTRINVYCTCLPSDVHSFDMAGEASIQQDKPKYSSVSVHPYSQTHCMLIKNSASEFICLDST